MSVESSLRRVLRQLDEFERLLHLHAVRVPSLSDWTIGNHIEHSINVTSSVLARLADPEAKSVEGKPLRMIGRVVLLTGYIPRGRGKSPKAMLPSDADIEAVRPRLSELRATVKRQLADPSSLKQSRMLFPHPVFGLLDAPKWVRFTDIHQHHHLKIMRDIASASLR